MLSYPVLATTLLLVLLGVVQVLSQLWSGQFSSRFLLASRQRSALGSSQHLVELTDPLVESSSFFSARLVVLALQPYLFVAL